MAKFVLVYKGGKMAETPAAQKKAMEQWMGWFGQLGSAVVDGGAPFGGSASVDSSGKSSKTNGSGLTGYSILEAKTLTDATKHAKGCPVLTTGGSVEVYEALPM
jgi:hypothetical protein